MPNEIQPPSFEARKKTLLAEGSRYRSGISQSKQTLYANLSADMLARTAVSHVTAVAYSAFHNVFSIDGLKNGNLQKMVPLVISGYAALSRRSLIKPIFRGSLVVAGLGAAAVLFFRNKKSKKAVSAPTR